MVERKKRLGKGLEALFGEYLPPESGASDGSFRQIPVSHIAPNPFQPRVHFTEEQLAELAGSISENGLLQPLVVRQATEHAPEGAQWELVAGERRWRAVRRLGWTEAPAIVRELDDRAMLIVAIVENVHRSALWPLEEAEGYRRLIDEFGLTQKEVAEKVGKDRSTVANLLRLLQLPPSVQRYLNTEHERFTMGHARAILGAGDERRMAELARRTIDEGLTVRTVEEMVRQGRKNDTAKKARPAAPAVSDAHLRHLETELQRHLGTAVRIHVGQGQSGRIEIPFYDPNDFERVLEALLGAEAVRG